MLNFPEPAAGEVKTRRLYYDLPSGAEAPIPDTFLVSIGQLGGQPRVNSIYHVVSVRARKVQQPHCCRYFLQVLLAPDMKPYTELAVADGIPTVKVKGVLAYPLFWYPRTKRGAGP